jgi:hypothetical protein
MVWDAPVPIGRSKDLRVAPACQLLDRAPAPARRAHPCDRRTRCARSSWLGCIRRRSRLDRSGQAAMSRTASAPPSTASTSVPSFGSCRSRESGEQISSDAAGRGGRGARHVRAGDTRTASGRGGGPVTGCRGGRGRSRAPGGAGHPALRRARESSRGPRLERERDPA